jgi:radical SAM protein with 4Fe4S-binding SPASM domain
MRTIQYKKFSWDTHNKNWKQKKPNVCQFELTFKCGLHCRHCYSDCYNNPACIKRELNTQDIKLIIDKIHKMGVLWLCFTGGDPLEREDFLDIYSYAKDKGFLLTVFTSGYSMTEEIADYFKKRPPFVVEITINGISKEGYEDITGIGGSHEKAMAGLEMMLERKIPLKVKTMATRQNYKELPQIKAFLEEKGLKFRPSSLLHVRLNSDKAPCSLRLSPGEILGLDGLFGGRGNPCGCPDVGAIHELPLHNRAGTSPAPTNNRLFRCAAGGGDGLNLDPYGKMFMCSCIRTPTIDFLKADLSEIENMRKTFTDLATSGFKTHSKCQRCGIIDKCHLCPGKALLETGDLEAPVEYYCQLAEATSEKMERGSLAR